MYKVREKIEIKLIWNMQTYLFRYYVGTQPVGTIITFIQILQNIFHIVRFAPSTIVLKF